MSDCRIVDRQHSLKTGQSAKVMICYLYSVEENYAISYLKEILPEVKVTLKIGASTDVAITEPFEQKGCGSRRSKLPSAGGFLVCKCNCAWKIFKICSMSGTIIIRK